jgi:hypothetical protein
MNVFKNKAKRQKSCASPVNAQKDKRLSKRDSGNVGNNEPQPDCDNGTATPGGYSRLELETLALAIARLEQLRAVTGGGVQHFDMSALSQAELLRLEWLAGCECHNCEQFGSRDNFQTEKGLAEIQELDALLAKCKPVGGSGMLRDMRECIAAMLENTAKSAVGQI